MDEQARRKPDGIVALSARKAEEAREDRRSVMIPLGGGLFLGNAVAANDPLGLIDAGITQTLNLAVNLDVPPLTLADGTAVRRAKIGLIDGPGNDPWHLVAAVLAIAGMMAQAAPGKPSYPDHRPGGLLVHCRGGRSRSVAALALYLSWTEPTRFADPDAALAFLREGRGLTSAHPGAAMLSLVGAAWTRLAHQRVEAG